MRGAAKSPESLVRKKNGKHAFYFDLIVLFCVFGFQIYHWASLIHTALLKLIEVKHINFFGK